MKKYLLIASLLAFSACSQKSSEKAPETINATTTASIEIMDPRVRVPPKGGDMTAAYVTLKNNSDKALKIIGASSDIAPRLELHTHEKSADGIMSMKQVESFEIAAKSGFELAPGGAHIMLFETKQDLKAGDNATITLKFENAPDLVINAKMVDNPVLENQSGGKEGHSH